LAYGVVHMPQLYFSQHLNPNYFNSRSILLNIIIYQITRYFVPHVISKIMVYRAKRVNLKFKMAAIVKLRESLDNLIRDKTRLSSRSSVARSTMDSVEMHASSATNELCSSHCESTESRSISVLPSISSSCLELSQSHKRGVTEITVAPIISRAESYWSLFAAVLAVNLVTVTYFKYVISIIADGKVDINTMNFDPFDQAMFAFDETAGTIDDQWDKRILINEIAWFPDIDPKHLAEGETDISGCKFLHDFNQSMRKSIEDDYEQEGSIGNWDYDDKYKKTQCDQDMSCIWYMNQCANSKPLGTYGFTNIDIIGGRKIKLCDLVKTDKCFHVERQSITKELIISLIGVFLLAIADATNVFYTHLMLRLRAGHSQNALEGYLSMFNYIRRFGICIIWLQLNAVVRPMIHIWDEYSFVQIAALCFTACAIYDIHPGRGDMPIRHRSYISAAIN